MALLRLSKKALIKQLQKTSRRSLQKLALMLRLSNHTDKIALKAVPITIGTAFSLWPLWGLPSAFFVVKFILSFPPFYFLIYECQFFAGLTTYRSVFLSPSHKIRDYIFYRSEG